MDGSTVVLKGGGTFEQGQRYLVKSKQGQEMNMIYRGKQLVEMKEFDPTVQKQQQQQQQQGIIINLCRIRECMTFADKYMI